jgi:hypothetical protein
MAKKAAKQKTIDTIKHTDDKRMNIPTAEHQSVLQKEEETLRTVRYARNTDLDPQLVWRGKDEKDWSDLVVQAPPLYIQEKVHPKVLIDDLLRTSRKSEQDAEGANFDLFADFNGIPEGVDKTEFYKHDQNWSNRMILGDSLQVMASLAEREGLRGKVQCIYLDPPYGIKFNSNFQWSTTSRDVKDGKLDPSTGEVRSDSADGIACWFIDTDYKGESFFVRHAYFLGQNDPYKSLKTTLRAEINADAWETLHSDTSRPFPIPASGRIAVKVINHLGDEG